MEISSYDLKANETILIDLLESFQEEHKGFVPYQKEQISYAMTDKGKYCGGLTASIFMNTMHVGLLAVPECCRGQGIGKKLLAKAEAKAKESQCKYININTQDYQALTFYQAQGYQVFGKIPDCPFPGTTKYYLIKNLEGDFL